MKLYDLPMRATPRPKIFGLNPNDHEDGWVEFDHLDGMYSFCIAYDGEGNKLGICHLAGVTPLVECEGGYRVGEES